MFVKAFRKRAEEFGTMRRSKKSNAKQNKKTMEVCRCADELVFIYP